MNAPIVLPWPLRSGLEGTTRALFDLGDQSSTDFLRPAGEAALVSPDSVSWRAFKNPLCFLSAASAVIMELAEPRGGPVCGSTQPSASIRLDDYAGRDSLPWLRSTAPAAQLRPWSEAMASQLERSDILFEFLAIMRSAPILPLPLRPVQPLLIRAAIDLTPHWLRRIVGLTDHGLNALEVGVVRQIGAFADRLVLEINPAIQACRRMGLSANCLYSR